MAILSAHFAFAATAGPAGFKQLGAFHIRATTAAVVNIRANAANGTIIVPLNLAAGECVGNSYGASPLNAEGWYVEVVSGTVVGSLSGS